MCFGALSGPLIGSQKGRHQIDDLVCLFNWVRVIERGLYSQPMMFQNGLKKDKAFQ